MAIGVRLSASAQLEVQIIHHAAVTGRAFCDADGMKQIPLAGDKSLQYDDAVFKRYGNVRIVEIRIIPKRGLDANVQRHLRDYGAAKKSDEE